jgi:GTPase SAR1 family protein
MFLKKFSAGSNSSPDLSISESATIRVVGDRASGKTTYMAALARWPNASPNSPVETVSAVNDDGETLIVKAQTLLEQGLPLDPTLLAQSSVATDLPDYAIRITLKGQFSWRNPKVQSGSQLINLNINCKDYSGEFFKDLVSRPNDPQIRDYMEDCVNANGILLLIDGNAYKRDQDYANSLDKFLVALDRASLEAGKRRIALVLTKCEQPELWVNRHKPKEMVQMRFPQIHRRLSAWQGMGAGQVEYFSASALGMLGTTYPAPNATRLSRDSGGVAAVLKEPKRWRPFGLVAPIYWLCTGERHKKLEEE